jgi:hypothetical protein
MVFGWSGGMPFVAIADFGDWTVNAPGATEREARAALRKALTDLGY